jgi:hypothetical protein
MMIRDEDDDTRPLAFGQRREGCVPLGQQIRDREDAYWGPGKVTIDREEYDSLVDDSTKLAEMEDALIDMLARIAGLTEGLKRATHGAD